MDTTEKEIEMGANAIATKVKLPKEQKEKIYAKLVKEFWMAIAIFIYFIFVNVSYGKLEDNMYINCLKACAGILICSTIVMLEIAYRKDSGVIALHSVEILVLAILTLFMPYIYFYRGLALRFLYSFSSMYIAIYYAIKALIIYQIEVKKYISGLSDVKEIILDEDVSYLDEKNERKFEDVRKFDEEIEKKIEENKKNKRKIDLIRKENKKRRSQKKLDENENTEETSKVTEAIKESNQNIEKENKTEEKKVESNSDKKVSRRKKKREVKSMATNRKNKKENGDNEND